MAPLHTDGKVADQIFDDNELLFRRVPKTHIDEDGEVNILALPGSELKFEKNPPDCTSVVREKYCVDHTDVLHPDCANDRDYSATHAACYWRVGDLVKGVAVDPPQQCATKIWDLFPFHDPQPKCYAHTTICCCEQTKPETADKPSQNIRNQFRHWLQENIKLYKPSQPVSVAEIPRR